MSALRVALCADFPEERWPSMDRVANELAADVRRSHSAEVDLTPVCPPFARRATRIARSRPLFTVDRALNRWWDYPRHVESDRVRVRRLSCHRSQLCPARSPSAFRADRRHLPRPRYIPLGAEAGGRAAIGAVPEGDAPDSAPGSSRLPGLPATAPRSATSCSASVSFPRSASASCRWESVRGFRQSRTPRPDRARRASGGGWSKAGAIELLHVGSTIARKRIDALLAICAALVPRVPDLHLVRVGGAFTDRSNG